MTLKSLAVLEAGFYELITPLGKFELCVSAFCRVTQSDTD